MGTNFELLFDIFYVIEIQIYFIYEQGLIFKKTSNVYCMYYI